MGLEREEEGTEVKGAAGRDSGGWIGGLPTWYSLCWFRPWQQKQVMRDLRGSMAFPPSGEGPLVGFQRNTGIGAYPVKG